MALFFHLNRSQDSAHAHPSTHCGLRARIRLEALFLARYQSADELNALHPHVSHVVVAEVWGSRLR